VSTTISPNTKLELQETKGHFQRLLFGTPLYCNQ